MYPMKYYPIFLRVAGRQCLVVGGGKVAEQKVKSLVHAGARVTVLSPDLTPALAAFAATRQISHHARVYVTGDLRGFFLAYAATTDEELQRTLAAEAAQAGVLLNVVDQPQLCDFIMPAVLERGDLVIATSTSGASPTMAKRIRSELASTFGSEYDLALQLLRRLREQLAAQSCPPPDRRRILTALVDSPLLDYLRTRQTDALDRLLAATVGDGTSLATLGMELS